MGFTIDASVLEKLRTDYEPGSRVQLVKMEDVQAPPLGSLGTVRYVDDAGIIHVAWDTGGSLGVVYGEDKVVKVRPFSSGQEMYKYLLTGRDLYSKSNECYVFEYNDAHALCHYSLDKWTVSAILRRKDASDDYWGGFLSTGGYILDDSEYDDNEHRYSSDEAMRALYLRPSIEFCNEMYNAAVWIDTADVTEDYLNADFEEKNDAK